MKKKFESSAEYKKLVQCRLGVRVCENEAQTILNGSWRT